MQSLNANRDFKWFNPPKTKSIKQNKAFIENGHVKILLSSDITGWVTANRGYPQLLYDATLITMIEELQSLTIHKEKMDQCQSIATYIEETYSEDVNYHDMRVLQVHTIDPETTFTVVRSENRECIIPVHMFEFYTMGDTSNIEEQEFEQKDHELTDILKQAEANELKENEKKTA